MVDVASTEGRNPIEDIKTINAELGAYNPELLQRPQVIAANKTDVIFEEDENPVDRLAAEFEPQGIKVFPISAVSGKGLKELLYEVRRMLDELDEKPTVFEKEFFMEDILDDPNEPFTVSRADNGAFIIEGERIDRMLGYTNLDSEKGFNYFQKFMRENGIIERLKEMGIKEGDTVNVGGYLDFEYYD